MVFSIHLEQTRRDVYRADCPSLPGCFAVGPSADQAREKMTEAIVWYLAGLKVAPPENLELQVSENAAEYL